MRAFLLPAASLTMLLGTSGCCTMARLFCGPDRSAWVSVDFRTPEHAARTLLEALKRDDPEVVYECLSNSYRRRLGLDQATLQLAWQKVRDQLPGLHLAGYADVPTPTRRGADRASLAVDVEGYVIDIDLERESYWQVRYRPTGSDGQFGPALGQGAQVASFADRAVVAVISDEDALDVRSRLTLRPLEFTHSVDEVSLDDVEFAGLFREWKVLDLRQRR